MHPEGPRRFIADFRDTALIDYVQRSRDGGYEPEVSALIDALAPRLGTVVDVGANWGYFPALLTTNPGFAGCVHAFEIAPRSIRALAAMVESCDLGRQVICHAIGLSDRECMVRLEEGVHSALTRIAPSATGAEARVIPLDRIEIGAPDLIKLDVEGHEAAVLRGAVERISRGRPLIVLESWYLSNAIGDMLAPLALLRRLGYRLFQLGWRRQSADPMTYSRMPPRQEPASLALVPLALEERALLPIALNLAAIHPDRLSLLDGLAEPWP